MCACMCMYVKQDVGHVAVQVATSLCSFLYSIVCTSRFILKEEKEFD